RRPDEKILMPSVPAIIKIISSHAGLVRLGIDAPGHVPILREELVRNDRADVPPPLSAPHDGHGQRHTVRSRLHNLTLGLTLLRRHLASADPEARRTLARLEAELEGLRLHVTTDEEADTVGSFAAPAPR